MNILVITFRNDFFSDTQMRNECRSMRRQRMPENATLSHRTAIKRIMMPEISVKMMLTMLFQCISCAITAKHVKCLQSLIIRGCSCIMNSPFNGQASSFFVTNCKSTLIIYSCKIRNVSISHPSLPLNDYLTEEWHLERHL